MACNQISHRRRWVCEEGHIINRLFVLNNLSGHSFARRFSQMGLNVLIGGTAKITKLAALAADNALCVAVHLGKLRGSFSLQFFGDFIFNHSRLCGLQFGISYRRFVVVLCRVINPLRQIILAGYVRVFYTTVRRMKLFHNFGATRLSIWYKFLGHSLILRPRGLVNGIGADCPEGSANDS